MNINILLELKNIRSWRESNKSCQVKIYYYFIFLKVVGTDEAPNNEDYIYILTDLKMIWRWTLTKQ